MKSWGRRLITAVTLVGIILPGTARAGDEQPRLAVLPLSATRIADDTVSILDTLLVNAVHRTTEYRVIGAADISAMMGLENLKDALGCDNVACAVELSGALGVQHLISGSVGQLGDQMVISLVLIDTDRQEVTARAERLVPNDENLYPDALAGVVRDLFGVAPAGASATVGDTGSPPSTDGSAEPADEPTPAEPQQPPPDAPPMLKPRPSTTAASVSDGMPVPFWIGLGTTVVLGATGGVLFALKGSESDIRDEQYQSFLDANSEGTKDTRFEEVESAVSRHNILLYASWVSFALAAGAAVFTLTHTDSSTDGDGSVVLVGPTPGGVLVGAGGRF